MISSAWIPFLLVSVLLFSSNDAFITTQRTRRIPHSFNNAAISLPMARNSYDRNNKPAKADGILIEKNRQRVQMAGRVGTKRFVDPCKVFLGNLPFDANEKDVKLFFKDNLGTTFNVKSVKIIRDWKTNKSKGYGFALFTDPIFATSAMEVLNGRPLKGRPMKLSQGKKQPKENELYIKKKKKQQAALDAEEQAIQQGLDEAVEDDDDDDDGVELDEFDTDDDVLFGEEDDDEEFEYDGIFEEMYPKYEALSEEEMKLNREQRREAAKRKKRRKLPHKGFELPATDSETPLEY